MFVSRYYPIGGGHSHLARMEICNEKAGGDWDRLANMMTVDGDFPWRPLCVTRGQICMGLTVPEAKLVSH